MAAALRCAQALHSPMCSSARVLCAWHTMAGWLLLEQNGSRGLKQNHLVLLYYFHHAINPLILAWSLGKVDLEFNFSFSLGALTATLSSCTTAICWAEAMTVSVLHPMGFAGVRGQLNKCDHFGKLLLGAEALPFARS